MSSLDVLPCRDSSALAVQRRRELELPWHDAARLGRSAVVAAERGWYAGPHGEPVDWADEVRRARAAAVSIPPDATLPTRAVVQQPVTRVRVANETTLGAARLLAAGGVRPLALNFANGLHPGGGFLDGATAQEEVLCRSSALHATLAGDAMYAEHAARPRPDSTAWAILSPGVPVFRLDDGTALEAPWPLDFLTCAAPYAPHIGATESAALLRVRIRRVLAVARAYGYTVVVLGAWGCGAFGNDPHATAADFRRALEGDFAGAFSDVVFAIADWSPERRFLGPFRDVFGGAPSGGGDGVSSVA